MILSVEHRHSTARKRLRGFDASGAHVFTTCGYEACGPVAEEKGVQMIRDSKEVRRNVKIRLLLYSVSDLEREREGDGDPR